MKVAVIILNYNSFSDCLKCIEFLKCQEKVELEIIVVDNCSPRDGEQEAIRQLCHEQDCTFIASPENRGYNAGNNIGLRYAAEKGHKYALIANPDMEFPQRDYVKQMAVIMENLNDVAVCGSNILNISGKRENPWKFPSLWEEFPFLVQLCRLLGKQRKPLVPQNGYCDILHGCCIMVNIPIIIQLGFFDENLFLFCEEVTLGKQVKMHNKKMYYLHDTIAIHRHIDSTKGSIRNRYKLFWESKVYYLKKYSGYKGIVLMLIYLSQLAHYAGKMAYFKFKKIS